MDSEKKETILFVDDEESIVNVSAEYFQRKGYRTLTARTGPEALKILAGETIDCCFTDINMPEMNGLELAERIRTHDNTMPVIVMTGYPSLENTIQTIKNGVVDFLIKPVNLKQMELCVQRVMQQRKMFVENILLKKEVEGKQRLQKHLENKPLEELCELMALAPEAEEPRPVSYAGAAGAVGNRQASDFDENDVLPLPTLNFEKEEKQAEHV